MSHWNEVHERSSFLINCGYRKHDHLCRHVLENIFRVSRLLALALLSISSAIRLDLQERGHLYCKSSITLILVSL